MILVTGGTGFLGSHLLRKLANAGEPVRALYRSTIPSQLNDVKDKIEWLKGDVLDVGALEDAMEGVDQVYHSAAVVSFHPSAHAQMMKINVEGTANVVNLALDAGVKKLVHVSSVAAIGRAKDNAMVDEEIEWVDSKNNSQYGVSKHLAEMEVWRGNAEGLDVAVVNPSIILGSGFWEDGSGMIIKNAWKEFPFYTDGVTGFVDVDDVAEIMIRLMKSDIKGQRYVVAAENWKYQDLFNALAKELNKKPPHIHVKPWLAEIVWRVEALKTRITGKKALLTKETARTAQMKVTYDNRKILSALPGFSFKPLKVTIADMSRLFIEHKKLSQQ